MGKAPRQADGSRPIVSGKTEREVVQRLNAVLGDQARGKPTGAGGTKLTDYLQWWLRQVAPGRGRSPNTVANYRWAVGYLCAGLGKQTLRGLTVEQVEAFLAERAADGMTWSSVRLLRGTLVMALTEAERRDKVHRNVARLALLPPELKPSAGAGRTLTVDQARKLLEAAEGDELEALVVTGLLTGLRPGELLGLSWEDVDLEACRLHVRGSLKNEGGHLSIGRTKTPKSRRSLDLPGPVVKALKAHRGRQKRQRMLVGSEWQDHGLIFTTGFGTPLDPSNLRKRFSDLTNKAGLGHWAPKELRHSAASLLSAAGVPLEQIADVLGHVDTRMVQHVYRHRTTSSIDAHVAPMTELFGD